MTPVILKCQQPDLSQLTQNPVHVDCAEAEGVGQYVLSERTFELLQDRDDLLLVEPALTHDVRLLVLGRTLHQIEGVSGGKVNRLASYARSVDLLIANNWQGLEISELIRSQISALVDLDGNQFAANGPKLRISTQAAHSLGLALHELATIALKFGSLCVPQGCVHLTWSVLQTENGPRFNLI